MARLGCDDDDDDDDDDDGDGDDDDGDDDDDDDGDGDDDDGDDDDDVQNQCLMLTPLIDIEEKTCSRKGSVPTHHLKYKACPGQLC